LKKTGFSLTTKKAAVFGSVLHYFIEVIGCRILFLFFDNIVNSIKFSQEINEEYSANICQNLGEKDNAELFSKKALALYK